MKTDLGTFSVKGMGCFWINAICGVSLILKAGVKIAIKPFGEGQEQPFWPQLPLQLSSLQQRFLVFFDVLQHSFWQVFLDFISFLRLLVPHAQASTVGAAVKTSNNHILSIMETSNFIS